MGVVCYSSKIYYDDTDAGGVVYYANYLKLCERAKQEFFLKHGCDLFKLHFQNIYLVVKEVKANYIKSILLGETVDVSVSINKIKRASLSLHFDILCKDELRASVDIMSVAVKEGSKIVRLPECVKNLPIE